MGTQRFLYKVSAEKGCDTTWTTLAFMTTVAVLSTILFLAFGGKIESYRYLILISFINSASFLIATMAHMEALKHMAASIVYPIIRLNAVVVVVFSIVFFNDQLTIYQVMGISLAMVVIATLTRGIEKSAFPRGKLRLGLIFIFTSMLAGSIAAISSKFAAIHTNNLAFMALSYAMSALSSLGIKGKLETEGSREKRRGTLKIGFCMGIINFAGYYSFLQALSKGPLSIIASIIGMHFVIAIILSAIIYKEKLTPLRIGGIALTIASIVLLRM
jgi:drug/metabolite transporter (DMT)-like permease